MNIQINMNLKHLLILMAFIGIIAVASAATSVLRDTTSEVQGLNVTSINVSDNVASTGLTQVKVGAFTRDVSVASGTQAITGVGFKPKAVIFLGVVNTAAQMSIGADDGATPTAVLDYQTVSADTFAHSSGTYSIFMMFGSSIEHKGKIASFDTDGFTISWTKVGSPTGTATIQYLAFR